MLTGEDELQALFLLRDLRAAPVTVTLSEHLVAMGKA